MNTIPFDTLKMARKLEAAGFPGPQAAGAAEAMAEAMSGSELATKADLVGIKTDMAGIKADLFAVKADLVGVKTDLVAVKTDMVTVKADLVTVKTDLVTVKEDLTQEIGLVRTDLTREIGLVRTDLGREIERETGLVRTDLTRELAASEFRLTAAIARVHSDLEVLRRDMTIRLGAMAIASTGVMLAAMRFMLTHP
jgi:hypothetical protein